LTSESALDTIGGYSNYEDDLSDADVSIRLRNMRATL
jgi:hypothetical protein